MTTANGREVRNYRLSYADFARDLRIASTFVWQRRTGEGGIPEYITPSSIERTAALTLEWREGLHFYDWINAAGAVVTNPGQTNVVEAAAYQELAHLIQHNAIPSPDLAKTVRKDVRRAVRNGHSACLASKGAADVLYEYRRKAEALLIPA